MKRAAVCALLSLSFANLQILAQEPAARGASPARAQAAPAPAPAKAAEKTSAKPASADPLKSAFGGGLGAQTDGPVTTEIYADEALFDSSKYVGTFIGHVIVKDPRFNIQADKLTVYLGKGETKGLEKAIAEGNVGVVREQPGENGAAPVRSVGRADRAVYTTADGNVELSVTPRVQSGMNTHIATSPDTVMLINQGGQLTTRGPSRTDIRQEPKPAAPPKP
jgi:lipopolysaccharide transport protein LptA